MNFFKKIFSIKFRAVKKELNELTIQDKKNIIKEYNEHMDTSRENVTSMLLSNPANVMLAVKKNSDAAIAKVCKKYNITENIFWVIHKEFE